MNKNLHSPKILTEFARDFEEEPSTLFNKLVKLTASIYNSGSETSSNDNHNVENKTSPINNVHEEKQESLNNVQTQLSNQVPCYGPSFVHERTSINVLKRLSNIVSQRSTSYQNYKHTELQKLWMPDSTSIECYDCSAKFSTFRRKHHCRLCGQIFCTKCCNQVVPGKLINCTGGKNDLAIQNIDSAEDRAQRNRFKKSINRLAKIDFAKMGSILPIARKGHLAAVCDTRSKHNVEEQNAFPEEEVSDECIEAQQNFISDLKVCTYCSKVVLTYLKSSNITADLKSDLKALQDDLSNKLSSNSFCNPNDGDTYTITSQRRKVSVGYQEERFVSTQTTTMSSADRKSILQQSSSLRALYEEMIKVLPNVNRGLNLTSYLINTQKSSNNRQALAILNAMTEAGFLIPLLVDTTQFSYTEPESEEASSFIVFDENLEYKFLWHDDQVSQSGSYELDVDFKSNSVHIMRPNIIDAHEPVTMGNGSSRSQCAITCHQKSLDEYIYKDALHLESHQRLPVLFCSFYYNLNAPSSFCAQPSFLNMQFYGHNDIMLGEFLERYCFRSTYICKSCNVPMMDHVRRYVHSQGCVQVKLSEDVNKLDTGTILVTSKCNICNEITTPTPMSNDTWCYSFAKYLESRFHGHAYKCRGLKNHTNCKHSLHRDHTQYFSYMGLVASFAYNPVEMWEIHLPTMIVQLIPPKITCNTKQIVEDVKNFAITGYEIYAKIFDKLAYLSEDTDSFAKLKKKANQDQMGFKQNVEVIQTLLTEPNVPADEIENAMLLLKKSLAETTDEWEPKLQEIMVQTRSNQTKLDLANVDSGTIVTEDFTSSIEDSSTTDKTLSETFISEEGKSDELMFESITEGNKIDDKPTKDFERKGAKSLFSQLLSSNDLTHVLNSPLPANEHYNIKTGLFPVMVDDQDVSSCIAYSLVSREYLKALDNLYSETATDSSPNLMRKSLDIGLVTETDDLNQIKLESGEIKKNKQSYIEIHFQDSVTNFVCKVYFAKEFDQLRNNLLKQPITKSEDVRYKQTDMHKKPNDTRKNEDNKDLPGSMFARSFCKSIKWEARGGKSGSKFSKTMDDQFVLKEMSKTDISLFENFAPNYFDYLQQCLSKDQPTLLVKIFGVFKVAIRRKDFTSVEKTVLVMENLFSNKDISDKFDLKGSLRNRMVDPNRQTGEIVLMDENLMQMSWTNPLYIFTHSRTILKEAIEQDASFLEKNGVMDYSLLVGLDNKKHLLVVGIIDYIRTFTLDKRVESIIKQSGIMGGHGKLPTVVSPKMYRTRFSEAMDRYFLAVPDRWEGLTKHSLLEYT
ncbi:putative 1-phosphatidylinositol 3-phosphate 5-kinase isoform X3 [Wyeomyia smithii]|uniref:putative 1-phosphatidylinositol 3-phosphate 5-kinase isoform X3 n=1 Tax=Wyeomyia smithii TaxID=174621 RepID=UPI002467C8AC|nr:putative 1-phosphatidylinositol 3-phosphate 5-kinase isoform X3 [Wyeomyia smithii]